MTWLQWLVGFLLGRAAEAPPPPAAPRSDPPPPIGRVHVWEYFEPNPSRRPLQHPYCIYCGETKTERNVAELCPKLRP